MHTYLEQQGYQIDSLYEGESLDVFLEKNHVDLVILDLVLPGRNGLDWLAWLNKKQPSLPVIILSAEQNVEMRIATLAAGAVDYLAKPFHPIELLLRIKNILRIHQPQPQTTSKLADYQYCFDAEHALFFRANTTIKLTTTETLLLKFFFEHVGEIVSRDTISEALRGSRHHPLDRSIDVHINRLRKKIEERPSLPKYLNTVWGKGYRFIPPKKPNPPAAS